MELIFEMLTVDGLSSCACSCRISALDHEARNDPMEDAAIVVVIEAVLYEVTRGERGFSRPKFYLNFSMRGDEYDLGWGRRLLFGGSRQIHL